MKCIRGEIGQSDYPYKHMMHVSSFLTMAMHDVQPTLSDKIDLSAHVRHTFLSDTCVKQTSSTQSTLTRRCSQLQPIFSLLFLLTIILFQKRSEFQYRLQDKPAGVSRFNLMPLLALRISLRIVDRGLPSRFYRIYVLSQQKSRFGFPLKLKLKHSRHLLSIR